MQIFETLGRDLEIHNYDPCPTAACTHTLVKVAEVK